MNLVMRGLLPNNIITRNGDTLESDWPYFDENDPINSYNPLYVDAVVSNPPYSQKWDSDNKETDPRYARFGLAPKSKADYAFLLHDLFHVKPDGIMTIVLPHGVLFRGGEEGIIRKKLIEGNHIDAIIGLPANIFFGTGIPTIIIVLRQKRTNTDVLIVDASKGFEKVGKNNKLRASDIKRIADTIIHKETNPKFSRLVSRDEIRENEYNLNIPRYVDSSDTAESWDIYASMFGGIPVKEIHDLNMFWQAFPGLRDDLFLKTSSDYATLQVNDIKNVITQHPDVKAFAGRFSASFANFNSFLKKELLTNMLSLSIQKEETILSNDVFERLNTIPLIDKYEAYQILSDNWVKVAIDMEIIQSEGFHATKKVEPNMVTKKKNGKDHEVQEGWKGRIMPFELVQETYLAKELQQLKQKENRLLEISAELEELLDSLSEEEKEADTVNDAKDSFVYAAVAKEAKQFLADEKKYDVYDQDSYEAKMIKADKLITEEKDLKKQVKTQTAALHLKTKATIEKLTDAQVYELLELKWISPLVASLNHLPTVLIHGLTAKVQALANKYATTYAHVAQQMHQTESQLAALIDELTGNEFDMKGLSEFKTFLKGE
jgi:type I restriction enzyme M protein